jgi:hypothetical protein
MARPLAASNARLAEVTNAVSRPGPKVFRIRAFTSGRSVTTSSRSAGPVAPVVARRMGARRAGQDRAAPKGSLDAPKSSRNNHAPERRGDKRCLS